MSITLLLRGALDALIIFDERIGAVVGHRRVPNPLRMILQ